MNACIDIFKHALAITGFVAVMMLVIEYVNVRTQGEWQTRLARNRWGQYLLAAFLGATPGCLGAFAVVGSAARGVLAAGLVLFLLGLTFGQLGSLDRQWIRVTLLSVATVALFIVATVPDHFLDEHLWKHVARKHVPRIFLWTLGALVVMYFLTEKLHLEGALQEGKWFLLIAACLVGIIPESGPHLVFVTLYAQGSIPFSILLASSIVQDGHGMLPLLAQSRKAFLGIKMVNLLVGLLVGGAAMAAGW